MADLYYEVVRQEEDRASEIGFMLKIKVEGLEGLLNDVDDLIKHRMPKMRAIAVTAVAKALKDATVQQLSVVFDRPNRWTLGSVYYRSATVDNLDAYVWFKDDLGMDGKGTPAVKYLWAGVHGGPRRFKGYEVALQRFGVLPPGYYTVPGAGIRLDSHGNIPTGTITEILTGVGALVGMSDTAFYGKLGGYKRRKKTTANLFVVKQKHGGLMPGIWERSPETGKEFKSVLARQIGAYSDKPKAGQWYSDKEKKFHSVIQGRAVRPILIFVKTPQYTQRFPFYEWAEGFVNTRYPEVFNRIMDETLAYHKGKASR